VWASKRFPLRDAQITSMVIPQGRQSSDGSRDIGVANDDVNVDHGFGGESRNRSAANVLNCNRDVCDRAPDRPSQSLEKLWPAWIVVEHNDVVHLIYPWRANYTPAALAAGATGRRRLVRPCIVTR